MKYINTLKQLKKAAVMKKAVVFRADMKPFPAAFVINYSGGYLLNLFRDGMWVYEKK